MIGLKDDVGGIGLWRVYATGSLHKHGELQQMSSSMQQQLEWRRTKVLELMSKGETNQSEIARSIVCRDVAYLRQQAKENITRYVDERLPEEYEKCLVGLNSILKEAWTMSQINDNTKSDKIKALSLAKECYAMKLELLTNATVVDDAIRSVASRTTAPMTEKANSEDIVTVDEEVNNSDDIQGSEEDRSHKQQSATTTQTTLFSSRVWNKPFWIWNIEEHKVKDIML
jgi:hypothetical protein